MPQTLSRLFLIMYSSNVGKSFCSWIPKVSKFRERKRKLLFCFQSRPRQNEIRHLHVVVAQRRHRNVQKSLMRVQSCCSTNLNLLQRNVQKNVMHVQSCCSDNLNRLLFCRSRCLSSLLFSSFPGRTVYSQER